MHLLLGDFDDPLLMATKDVLAHQGRPSHHLTEAMLFDDTPLALRRGGEESASYLLLDSARVPLDALDGVLVRLPRRWWPPDMTLQDQAFVYHETIATWFCLLAGLACPVVNRFGLGWWLSDVNYHETLRSRLTRHLRQQEEYQRWLLAPAAPGAVQSVYLAGGELWPQGDGKAPELLRGETLALLACQQETGIAFCRLDLASEHDPTVIQVDPAPDVRREPDALVRELAAALLAVQP